MYAEAVSVKWHQKVAKLERILGSELTLWCCLMARCAVSSGLLPVHQGLKQRCSGGAVRLQQNSGALRAIPGPHEFTAHKQWRGDTTQQSIFSIPFHPQTRIWDSVFLKFLGILKSCPRVVCLRLWAMLRPRSVDCSFQGIILVRGFAGNFAGERCSCSQAENGSCLLGLSQLSVHHTWFGYRTPFHVESEISVCFHLLLPRRREFLFLLQPSGRCWRWRGMHLLLHFSLWQLYREFITVYFIKLHQKKRISPHCFYGSF